MLAVLWHLAVVLWRFGASSSANARRVVAGSSLAVLGASLMLGLPSIPGEYLIVDDSIRGGPFRGPPGDASGERKVYLGVARSITSPSEQEREARALDKEAFTRCMKALAEPSSAGVSEVERMVQRLSRSVQFADAKDLAFASLMRVCQRHASEAIRDLGQYFRRAVKNAMNSLCGRTAREQLFPAEDVPVYEACRQASASEDAIAVRRAMARLSSEDQLVLRMRHIEGLNYGEVAERLFVPEATARQRGHRAEKRLKELLETSTR
jgi:RNA polymerase sigma factor (sigma-70 family)